MAELFLLSSPIFTEFIFPFLLVFVLLFAILQKTKILGDSNKTSLLISLVIGLIFVSFSKAVGITIQLMAVMAVVAVIFLVFLILYGMVATTDQGLSIPNPLKITFGILVAIILLVSVLIFTDSWNTILDFLKGDTGKTVLLNAVFIIIIIVAIAVVLRTGSGKSS